MYIAALEPVDPVCGAGLHLLQPPRPPQILSPHQLLLDVCRRWAGIPEVLLCPRHDHRLTISTAKLTVGEVLALRCRSNRYKSMPVRLLNRIFWRHMSKAKLHRFKHFLRQENCVASSQVFRRRWSDTIATSIEMILKKGNCVAKSLCCRGAWNTNRVHESVL